MAGALPLRAALKRGALVTLANWPVIVVDFTIESLYKMALAVPIVGGAFMVAVLVGADVRGLFSEGVRSAAELVMASLVNSPVALASFVASVVVVLVGGAIVMLVVKMGTLFVLVAGERAAQDIGSVPLKFESFRRAYAYDVPVMLEAVGRFRHRAATLVIWLSVAYAFIGAAYLSAMAWAVHLTDGPWSAAWPLVVLLATSAGVVAVALANLVYDLVRIIVVADDCGVVAALGRLRSFLVQDARQVIGLFGVVGGLLTLATAASILATAALALVAWVPVIGLIVVPLQAAAWLVRGLAFQYMGLVALCAYQTQYRRFKDPGEPPVSLWVQRA
jgi:hypothetical protein